MQRFAVLGTRAKSQQSYKQVSVQRGRSGDRRGGLRQAIENKGRRKLRLDRRVVSTRHIVSDERQEGAVPGSERMLPEEAEGAWRYLRKKKR